MPIRKKKKYPIFDPEGSGYDYEAFDRSGIQRSPGQHYPSRHPRSGQLLKGRKHPTFHKTVAGEKKAGYEIYKGKNGKYYSKKIK
jgi:hypothetical protein